MIMNVSAGHLGTIFYIYTLWQSAEWKQASMLCLIGRFYQPRPRSRFRAYLAFSLCWKSLPYIVLDLAVFLLTLGKNRPPPLLNGRSSHIEKPYTLPPWSITRCRLIYLECTAENSAADGDGYTLMKVLQVTVICSVRNSQGLRFA